jgi:hypothetical protein
MSIRSILYLTQIFLGSLFFLVLSLIEQQQSSGFVIMVYILRLLILSIVFSLIIDPINNLWKRYIRKRDVIKLFSKGSLNDFMENAFAYLGCDTCF